MPKTISVRIDESLLEAVDAAVGSAQRARSEVIREALELWLRRRSLMEKVRRHRDGYQRHPVTPEEFAPVLEAQRWPKSGLKTTSAINLDNLASVPKTGLRAFAGTASPEILGDVREALLFALGFDLD